MGNRNISYTEDVIYMPTIKERTRKNIERTIGLPVSEITELSLDEEIAYVEKKTGKKVSFSKRTDSRKMSRGNALLSLGRIVTMSEIDKRLSNIK